MSQEGVFHGGVPGLRVGQEVLPSSRSGSKVPAFTDVYDYGRRGHQPPPKRAQKRRADTFHVWTTTNVLLAQAYALHYAMLRDPNGGRAAIYRVLPSGDCGRSTSEPPTCYFSWTATVVGLHSHIDLRDSRTLAWIESSTRSRRRTSIRARCSASRCPTFGGAFWSGASDELSRNRSRDAATGDPGKVPTVLRLGDAVLLTGTAVHDVAYLLGLGIRYRAQTDGCAPSSHHRRLLALLSDVSVSMAATPADSEHANVRTVLGDDHGDVEQVGTAEAARSLGVTEQHVRRLALGLAASRPWSLEIRPGRYRRRGLTTQRRDAG